MNPSDLSFEFKELQASRKRFEQMNKTLESRITFLECEDLKAKKMIEETKKQARELSEIKRKNLENQKNFEEIKNKQEKDLLEKAEKVKKFKEISRENALKNKTTILIKKQEKVLETRKFKEQNRKEASQQKDLNRQKNEALICSQKAREQRFLAEKSLINQEKAQKTATFVSEKISEELKKLAEQEQKLLDFEAKEKDLMSRLKQTQNVQKEVYEDFESLHLQNL